MLKVTPWITITYNIVEAVVAVTAGTVASSTALVGFGLDSVIEVSSAAAVAWLFAVEYIGHGELDVRARWTQPVPGRSGAP